MLDEGAPRSRLLPGSGCEPRAMAERVRAYGGTQLIAEIAWRRPRQQLRGDPLTSREHEVLVALARGLSKSRSGSGCSSPREPCAPT